MGVAAVVAAVVSLVKRSIRPAAFFALLVAGIGGFYWVTTTLITRQRPPVRILDPGLVPDHSYPRATSPPPSPCTAGTALLCWWLAPRTRPWVGAGAGAGLVALSRLYQGAHHVTDVLTSLCYTTAWLSSPASWACAPRPAPLRGSRSAVVGAPGDGAAEQDDPTAMSTTARHPASTGTTHPAPWVVSSEM